MALKMRDGRPRLLLLKVSLTILSVCFWTSCAPAISKHEPVECDLKKTRVVLDVGHTSQAQGATSARGIGEFQFNLNLARVIVSYLKAGGLDSVELLTVDGTGQSQLLSRRLKAAMIKPDFLISIHHDSVQPYLLKTWNFRGAEAKYNDDYRGFSIFIVRMRRGQLEELEFARRLSGEMLARGFVPTEYHALDILGERREVLDPRFGIYRNDELAVLRNEDVKIAILLEAGFIVNRNEELDAQSRDRQLRLAESIRASLRAYCGAKDS